MPIHKWLIMAGILGLSGCGGVAEAPPAPTAGGTPVAARSEASASPSPEPAGGTPVAAKPHAIVPVPKQQADWTPFNSTDGEYSVLLPATPQVSSQPGKLFTVHIISCEHLGATFTLSYFDPPPRSIVGGMAQASMKRDRDISIKDIQGSLKSEKNIFIEKDGRGWHGLASVMVNSDDLYTSRRYAAAGRMYLLQVKHAKSQDHAAEIARFFDSFKLSESSKPQ
jgi:hypothetical protein